MAKKIIWSPEALADLRSIHDYIAHDSEAIASNFIERLLNDVDRLAEFLLIGARIREFKRSDYRHLIVRPYRVIYRVADDAVFLIAVVHGARDLKRFLKGR
jgi:addiction module RelE/StbE family toxin